MIQFTDAVLDQAIAVRRGTKKLDSVSKKDLPLVKDALNRGNILMTYLRSKSSAPEATTPKPHIRAV